MSHAQRASTVTARALRRSAHLVVQRIALPLEHRVLVRPQNRTVSLRALHLRQSQTVVWKMPRHSKTMTGLHIQHVPIMRSVTLAILPKMIIQVHQRVSGVMAHVQKTIIAIQTQWHVQMVGLAMLAILT